MRKHDCSESESSSDAQMILPIFKVYFLSLPFLTTPLSEFVVYQETKIWNVTPELLVAISDQFAKVIPAQWSHAKVASKRRRSW